MSDIITLQNKEKYIGKMWVRKLSKRDKWSSYGDEKITKTTYYFIFDIVEGKIDGISKYGNADKIYQLYGIEALESGYDSKTYRSDTHFTNASPNYRKWRSLFFDRLEPVEDSEYIESICQEMILELFENKKGVDFFEKKYRTKNLSA